MTAIIKMQARTFLRNPSSVFFIIFPIIMMTVLGSVSTNGLPPEAASQTMLIVITNVITITTMSTLLTNFGSNFMELKRSVIIKRLGSTQVTKFEALTGFMIFAIFQTIFAIAYIVFLGTLFTNWTGWMAPEISWSLIDPLGATYGILLLMLVSFTMSFLIISLSPNSEVYQIFAFMYFFLVLYFGGLIFPGINIEWMNVFSLLLPHTYISHFLAGAFNGGNYLFNGTLVSIWNFTNWTDEYVLQGVSSLNIIMPIIVVIISGTIGLKNFNWDS